MKTVVLDSTELRKDWLCTGLKFQLISHMHGKMLSAVYVPAVVFEEVLAHYGREVAAFRQDLDKLNRRSRNLGLGSIAPDGDLLDLREHLNERFDEVLGFEVMPWPSVSHEDLARRATARIPPFDSKGSGYRDSLVWADVLDLARSGRQVAFVTDDRIFYGPDGKLAPGLQGEVDALPGTVELVTSFADWLLAQLPWDAQDLVAAVAASRDEIFYEFYMQSDFQDSLVPEVRDLGLPRPVHACRIIEVEWGGYFSPTGTSTTPGDVVVAKYVLDQIVAFEAELDEGEFDHNWQVSPVGLDGRVTVSGEVRLLVEVVVLFNGHEPGLAIDEVLWRRDDGSGPGADLISIHPDQAALFDLHS